MKYFTPELITRLGSLDDSTAAAAATQWEEAVTRHQEQLDLLRPDLPAAICQLWDEFYLHDAEVLSMGGRGETFVFVLRLDVPPRDLLILTYRLSEEPGIDTTVLPPERPSIRIFWMYDEVDMRKGEKPSGLHAILLSNGWEVQLRFRDMQMLSAQTLWPTAASMPVPTVLQPA